MSVFLRSRRQIQLLTALHFALTAIVLALVFFTTAVFSPVYADDFPGKGDRFAWSSALPFYNRGNKYLEHDRIEEAVQDFEEAIYRYEYDPDFYINYGVALRKRENYTGAEQAFKKAIELRPNDWQSWSNLANAYLKQNRLKDTIACFQKAMKIKPPPPAQEKAAMLKDIADITKILSMQKPAVAPAAAKAAELAANNSKTVKKSETGTNKSRVASKAGTKQGPNGSSKQDSSIPPSSSSGAAEKQDLKKSGWDWVN